ncbi:MAG: class I SAM-dependent methyltransferase, partial [Bacteroidota bacterium]
ERRSLHIMCSRNDYVRLAALVTVAKAKNIWLKVFGMCYPVEAPDQSYSRVQGQDYLKMVDVHESAQLSYGTFRISGLTDPSKQYAAAGGADQVMTVDLSNTYLNWAKENMALNGFTGAQYSYVRADVLQWLHELPNAVVDLIVLDPPTFSNSKMMKAIFDVQEMHVDLINACMRTLRPGGVLYFSTNARTFKMDTTAINGIIEDITAATTPFDFKGKLLRWCYRISTNSTSNTKS